MGALNDLLALFPDGTEQIPHGAVAKALLSNPRRACLRGTRDWLDKQMGELVRLKWVEPATGPRGGKGWRITVDGATVRANDIKRTARLDAAAKKRVAKRREEERQRAEDAWEALTRLPGLRIDGDVVVVEMRSADPTELTELARNVKQAADLILRRRALAR